MFKRSKFSFCTAKNISRLAKLLTVCCVLIVILLLRLEFLFNCAGVLSPTYFWEVTQTCMFMRKKMYSIDPRKFNQNMYK